MVRLALAVAAAAAIIASAPVVQQAFTAINGVFPSIGLAATALPIAVAVLLASARVRDRRRLRFAALALSIGGGTAYVALGGLTATESFHFVEYGLLACLFYFALLPAGSGSGDGSILVLPLLAGVATGVVDEWFQWFVPIRAGELRDILLDAAASLCGVLFAVSLSPPPQVTLSLHRRGRRRVLVGAAATLVLLAGFAVTVHVGHEVRDPDIGTFASRYTAVQLETLSHDRSSQWRTDPPVTIHRFGREDQFLSEGLWHIQRRNTAWEMNDLALAWRENLILEKYFAPVLDVATYASPAPQRWPAAQRAEAASRPGVDRDPVVDTEYRWPLYVF
jgi:hypothetical protein